MAYVAEVNSIYKASSCVWKRAYAAAIMYFKSIMRHKISCLVTGLEPHNPLIYGVIKWCRDKELDGSVLKILTPTLKFGSHIRSRWVNIKPRQMTFSTDYVSPFFYLTRRVNETLPPHTDSIAISHPRLRSTPSS